MKKLLALVLALVMTLSLCVVSSNAADFTDAKDVTYTEAADVMKAIKVIDGFTDGSFQPKALLTRAQAAKIICNLILGPTTADALVANSAPFADVPATHWAAGYIAYCASEGIINGVGNNKFDPDGNLTGYAFMKMLLGALGYDAKAEGYTGANWSIQVAKRALNIGLDDGLEGDFAGNKAVSREEACQFALNTLKATMVEYDTSSTITVGDITINSNSKAEEVTISNEGSKNYAGDSAVAAGLGTQQFCEKYFKDLKLVTTTNDDDFVRPALEWKYKTESVGTYADAPTATFEGKVTKAAMYDLLGKGVYDDLVANNAKLTAYVDGVTDSSYDDEACVAKNNTGAAYGTGNGSYTEVYVDDDGVGGDYAKVTVVVINTYVMQAKFDYNAKTEKLTVNQKTRPANGASVTTLAAEDWNVEDFKEDDYILYTYSKKANGGSQCGVQSIAKAELVSGKVDNWAKDNTNDVADKVTLDGTTYKFNVKGDKAVTFTVKDVATLVLDGQGYIVYVDKTSETNDDVVYVDTAAKSGFDTLAKVVFMDGSKKTVTVDYEDSATASAFKYSAGNLNWSASDKGFYAYDVNDNGEYVLSNYAYDGTVTTSVPAESGGVNGRATLLGTKVTSYTTDANTLATASKTLTANSSTVYVVYDGDDYNVYTGVKNAPDVKFENDTSSANSVVTYVVSNHGMDKALYIYLDASAAKEIDDAETDTSSLVYVLKTSTTAYQDADKHYYVEVKALVDGEEQTLNVKSNSSGSQSVLTAGRLYKNVKSNADGYVTNASAVTNGSDYVVVTSDKINAIAFDDDVLAIGGTSKFVNNAPVYIVTVKGTDALMNDANADYEVTVTDAEGLESFVTGYTYTYSYAGTLDDDGELTALYVRITASAEV